MATCKAWVGGQRCGAPATVVDADRGCAVCPDHRRGPVQQFTCCQCGQPIAVGGRWEYWNLTERRKDGRDPVICAACVSALLRGAVRALRRVPPAAWGADE